VYEELSAKIDDILAEIDATQGSAQEIGGYYYPDEDKLFATMSPSKTLKAILGA
jgi:isocitrate dehydrogenase